MKIAAVVVLYYPDHTLLQKLIEAVKPSADTIILVDNTPASNVATGDQADLDEKIIRISNGENLGVAEAHNQGIRTALDQGCDYLLILDQDSIPSTDLVARQLAALDQIDTAKRDRVAAIAPCFYDRRYDYAGSFMLIDRLIPRKLVCDGSATVHFVDYAISSGLLLNLTVIEKIGYMNSDLFIDYVDIEWCLRARARGYYVLAAFEATIRHELGDTIKTFLGGKVQIPLRSPERTYYMVRNAILLYRMKHIPLKWKLYDCMRLNMRINGYLMLNSARGRHLQAVIAGIRDGLE